jgi:hypothetical protein
MELKFSIEKCTQNATKRRRESVSILMIFQPFRMMVFFQLIADKLPETIFDFLFKLDFDGQAWPAVWPTERDVDQCV